MAIVFACPTCRTTLRLKDKYAGSRGSCPHCQSPIDVPGSTAVDELGLAPLDDAPPVRPASASPSAFDRPPPVPPTWAEPRSRTEDEYAPYRQTPGGNAPGGRPAVGAGRVQFCCQHCHAEMNAATSAAGRSFNCPTCGQRVRVPGIAANAPAPAAAWPNPLIAPVDHRSGTLDRRPPPAPPRRRTRSTGGPHLSTGIKIAGGAGGTLLVLLIFVARALLVTTPLLNDDPPDAKEFVEKAEQTVAAGERLLAVRRQITSAQAAQQLSSQFADDCFKLVELTAEQKRLGGKHLSGQLLRRYNAAEKRDKELGRLLEAEIARMNSIPGAAEILLAALQTRAAREPTSALAQLLREKGVPTMIGIPASPQPQIVHAPPARLGGAPGAQPNPGLSRPGVASQPSAIDDAHARMQKQHEEMRARAEQRHQEMRAGMERQQREAQARMNARTGRRPVAPAAIGAAPAGLPQPEAAPLPAAAPPNIAPPAIEPSVAAEQPVAAPAAAPTPPDERVADALAALESRDRQSSRRALADLKNLRPDDVHRAEVAHALDELLTDSDEKLRNAAAGAIEHWGTEENVPSLIKLLDDTNPFTRKSALAALGNIHDVRAAEPIAQRLSTPDSHNATAALKQMGPVAEDAVWPLLQSYEPKLRREAAGILYVIGTAKSLPKLKRLLRDQDAAVRVTAEQATAEIQARTGTPTEAETKKAAKPATKDRTLLKPVKPKP